MIRTQAVTLLVTIFIVATLLSTFANGQTNSWAIRTVKGENLFLTATDGCADELRLLQQADDAQPVHWNQTFYIFKLVDGQLTHASSLKDGDILLIGRCHRLLRVNSNGELNLGDNDLSSANYFSISRVHNYSDGKTDVVFAPQSKAGFFLNNGGRSVRADSDNQTSERNVFKLIPNPKIVDFPSCVGEACADLAIDRIGDDIQWTNIGKRTIYVQRNGYDETQTITPGQRAQGHVPYWNDWMARYQRRERPKPPPPPPAPSDSRRPNPVGTKAETSASTYDKPSNCIITPFASNVFVRLFYESRSGGKGAAIRPEFLLKVGDRVRVDTFGDRVVIDYRYSQQDGWNSNNHSWCHSGEVLKVP